MSDLAQQSPERQILALFAGQGYVDTLSAGSTLETLSTSGASDIYAIISQLRRFIHGASPAIGERWYDLTGRGLIELDGDLAELQSLLRFSTMAAVALVAGQLVYITALSTLDLAQADALPQALVAGMVLEDALIATVATIVPAGIVTLTDWSAITGSVALTIGTPYFLSTSTAGGMTTLVPSTGYILELGKASSSSAFNFAPLERIKRG